MGTRVGVGRGGFIQFFVELREGKVLCGNLYFRAGERALLCGTLVISIPLSLGLQCFNAIHIISGIS